MTGTEASRRAIRTPLGEHDTDLPRPELPHPVRVPILLVAVLYLTATGRWGSYVSLPGLPLFIADVLLASAVGTMLLAMRRSGVGLRSFLRALSRAHLALLLCLTLLAWTAVRGLLGLQDFIGTPLTALRDLAPYGYLVAAVVSFTLPAAASRLASGLVYGALSLHVVWVLGAPHLPGWPVSWPVLGGAAIFNARPDFDATVLGIAVALALHRLLVGWRDLRAGWMAALVLFAGLNAYALTLTPSRAGLLAGLAAVGVVLVARASPLAVRAGQAVGPVVPRRVLIAGLVLLLAVVSLSPAGQRAIEAFRGEQGLALGTVQAREAAWSGVFEYVTADAARTAVGVGFGPDFILDSGTSDALEGTQYENVRSPHNYLLGTLARLGVGGALLAMLIVCAGAALALGRLRRPVDEVTALAGLLVVSLPVTASLGVILESPFGAVPYFWAVGHLARGAWDERTEAPVVRV